MISKIKKVLKDAYINHLRKQGMRIGKNCEISKNVWKLQER